MKLLFTLIAFMCFSVTVVAQPTLPIRSGVHQFKHKFAEHPNMQSIPLIAKIKGHHIVLINKVASKVWPKGVIAEGELMWHAKSKQWIITLEPSDIDASDVGGCSDGPEVVDLKNKIYWTC
jgi:hypothetical protein